jgi:hypothetical protein
MALGKALGSAPAAPPAHDGALRDAHFTMAARVLLHGLMMIALLMSLFVA